jgi:C1A family cysteine protease
MSRSNATTIDRPDARDQSVTFPLTARPATVDRRALVPTVYHQGALGSCTAHAVATIFDAIQNRDFATHTAVKRFMPSRLFIYYNTRKIEGTIDRDAGSSIRNAIKSLSKDGTCDETLWPYNVAQFRDCPAPRAYENGLRNKTLRYMRVQQNEQQMEQCLSNGHPFAFGLRIYQYWYDDPSIRRTGIIRAPLTNDRFLGGHAMVCVGYDRARRVFMVVNSWGATWGDKGVCYIPYDYMLSPTQAYDLWIVQATSPPSI